MEWAILVVTLSLAAVWFWLLASLLRILRSRHSETFRALGSPSLVTNNTVSSSSRTVGWILAGRFRRLGDHQVDRIGGMLRVIFCSYVTLFIAWMIVILT